MTGLSSKRKEHSDLDKLESIKRQAGTGANAFLSGHGFGTEVCREHGSEYLIKAELLCACTFPIFS